MFTLQQTLDILLPPGLVQCVGWLLIQSLWQFTLITLALISIGPALRRQSAAMQYWILTSAMLLMALSPFATWFLLPIKAELLPITAITSRQSLPDEILESLEQSGEAIALVIPGDQIGIKGHLPRIEDVSNDQDRAVNGLVWPQQVASESVFQRGWAALEAAVGPWLSIMVSLWCCGVMLFSVRLISSWWTVQRFRRYETQPVPGFAKKALQRMIATLKIARPVEVLASSLVTTPVVVGCFRSVILIPSSFISSVPVSQLEAILAHELAHVRRYDYLVNLLQILIETLFFYHPAVWWLSQRIRVERENCCDDLVVSALDNRVEYGRALLAVEQLRGQIGSSLLLNVSGGSLLARVRRLFADPIQGDQRSSGVAVLVTFALSLAIILSWHTALVPGQGHVGQNEFGQNEPEQSEAAGEQILATSQPDADLNQSMRQIYGKVVDEDGNAVTGAVVNCKTNEGFESTFTTGINGIFTLFVPSQSLKLLLRISDERYQRMFVTQIRFDQPNRITTSNMEGLPMIAKIVPITEWQVSVVDADGKPVQGATVVALSLLTEVDVKETNANGQVTVRLPENSRPIIMALKSEVGYDYFLCDERDQQANLIENLIALDSKLTLRLDGAKAIRMKITNSDGQPVPGAIVEPSGVHRDGKEGNIVPFSSAFMQETDADGLVVFDWLPRDVKYGLIFSISAAGYNDGVLFVHRKDLDKSEVYEVQLSMLAVIQGQATVHGEEDVVRDTAIVGGQGAVPEPSLDIATSSTDGRFSADAAEMLERAKAQAVREGKRILVQETDLECEPSHLLSRFIEKHHEIFDRHFIWIKIERQRMEGTEAKMTNIRPSDLRSLPWITILDANGDVLGKSDLIPDDLRLYLQRIREKLHQLRDRFGTNHPTVLTLESINQQFKDDNYGFPSEHEAVDRFLAMLEAAAEAISDNDITILRNSLLGEVPKVP